MKRILLLFTLGAATLMSGQQKKLTLEESVLQQNRAFRSETMTGFQFIPDSDRYVYTAEGGKKILVASAKDRKASEWLTLEQVSAAIGAKAGSFNGIRFRNGNAFVIHAGGDLYEYDFTSKTGRKLLSVGDKESATPSGDFSKLAYTAKNNLHYQDASGKAVAVTNEKDGIVSGQSISRNEFGIEGGIFWSPKSAYLAFYQKDETGVADYPLLDINQTPGQLVSIKYPMIGQTSEKVRVGIHNLVTGKTVYISPKGAADDYLTNLSWTPDEKYVLIAELNRGQNDMRLNLYEAATGNFVRTILQETDTTWVEPEHPAFFPSEKSSNFVWISEKDGFNNLYYYSLDGKLIRKLTSNKFPLHHIEGASKDGNTIFFMATGPNGTNMLGYKVDLKGKQALVTKDEGQHRIAFSTDGNWVFDEFSSHSVPSKSLLYDKSGKASVLLQGSNKYEGYAIGTSEIKAIKAADGTTDLYTRLIKPSHFDPSRKYPVLVYVYGGPHAQLVTNSWLDGANLWMFWMAEQGYLVFTVDGRGSENRGKAFESVIHRRLGRNEMDDQLEGVNYLKSLPYVDGNRLAVHGWSYGGFMTTSLMLRHPGLFKVGVAGGPVTDWTFYEVMYGERYMDTPAENPDGFKENSTLNYVDELNGKLLLIHGTSDDVVVMQQNFALLKKFIEAGKQVDFFAYPMHKHNVIGKDRVHLMEKVVQYVMEKNQ